MKFKKLLVSEDNQLVLSDYGLNEDEVEILDLNKSLADVVEDVELQKFIIESSVDPQKIYIFCVKEDFGNNDQILEDIPNIKVLGKAIKKLFKKLPNIYFFVYNIYLKNEDAINPSLDEVKAAEVEAEEISNPEQPVEEQPVEDVVTAEEQPEQPELVQENLQPNEELPVSEEVQSLEESKPEEVLDDSVTNFVSDQGVSDPEYVQDEEQAAVEAVEAAIDEQPAPAEVPNKEFAAIEDLPVEEHSLNENAPVEATTDAEELDQFVDLGINDLVSKKEDDELRQYILDNTDIQAEATEDATNLFNEPEMLSENVPITKVISDSVDSIAAENNPEQDLENQTIVYEDKNTSIEMPVTFFDVEKEEEISYEDYNEFVNDYELNIHALKSIYDFIWRILVLNNYNLKLNDLLYIAVNNLDAFSIGQSDFVRQTANKAESLFDLILQLDIKLEFNNSLFYIYLAEFFKISGNKIVVNEKFLDTISIWVNKSSKEKFIAQIEQFMNYSTIYNKKIVFSYFIELANYVKGRLPSINSNISLIDIHRLLNNQYNKIRKENVFSFMVQRINQILEANGVVVEMYLVKTPDSMFGIEVNQASGLASDSWKTQMTMLYKKLIQNIHDYILLKGNKEIEIFNIFLDIRDLRIYQDVVEDRNVLSPETISIASNKPNVNFLTIGDELNRQDAIVPSQKYPNDVQYSYASPQNYVQNLEKGILMDRKFDTSKDSIVNNSTDNLTFPQQATLSNDEALREKYASKFNVAEFESSISRRIEEYERKIKNNISRIEAERKQLREKMEELKNI